MRKIALPLGFAGAENLPRTNTILQNCFLTPEERILPRPGINQLNTTGKVARGGFKWNGSLYQVVSTSLIKITNTDTGAFSTVGTIAGSNPIETAIGFNTAVIIIRGEGSYTLDKSDVIVNTSGNSNFVSWADVSHINGRFIYIPDDGSPAAFSNVGAGQTILAASFFDAEELPDLNNACFVLNNTLYIMGENSIQLFTNTPDETFPFLRIPRSLIRTGYIGGLLEYDDTFLFIGKKKDQVAGIFAIGQGRAPKISNERVDLLLSTYTQAELAEAIPGRINWRGYDIATFALRRDSLGYLNGNWFILDTVFDDISRPWGAGYITEFEQEYFTAFEDKIGKFAKVNKDYGNPITRRIGGGAYSTDRERFTVQNMSLGLGQGFNSAAGSIALRMTRNNVQFGPFIYRDTGAIGKYEDKIRWNLPGGLGNYDEWFGYEIYTTEDVDFPVDQLHAELF